MISTNIQPFIDFIEFAVDNGFPVDPLLLDKYDIIIERRKNNMSFTPLYKPGTITAKIKSKHHCENMAKYTQHFGFGTTTTEIPNDVFGDTVKVIAPINVINMFTCQTDDDRFVHIPLIFIENFIEW